MAILNRRKRGADVSRGHTVFPSSTAGSGKVQGDSEDGAYACKQCGFWNKAQETASPGGTEEGDGGITISDNEPNVTSGCAFCGSYNSR